MRGNYGDGYTGRITLHPFNEFEAVAVRQAHVGQADIEIVLCEQCLGTGDVLSRLSANIHATQRQRQQFADVGFVIDDQG